MAAKKAKAKTKSQPKASNFFVITNGFNKNHEWEENQEDAGIVGPVSEAKALEEVENKILAGCERSKITVISGRKLVLEMRLK